MIPRYSRPEMTALWTDEARFQLWLEIETAALEGMVELGVAPESSLKAVKEKGNFDTAKVLEIEKKVKHDVIAFLTNVAEYVGDEARFLHYGMTSSDLLDTTLAVQLCRATDIILKGVDDLLAALKDRAYEFKDTICVGRSHGIHAEPTTFGLKIAKFYDEVNRQKARIQAAREDIAVGAVSGPVGTYAHLSPKVEEHVCKKFGLKPANISTQIIVRDSHAALFLAFAQLAASIENISVEIRHLQRTEVREAEESFTKGQKGSSAMPHKRNPVLTENLTGLSRLMRSWAQSSLENITLWHERDISHSSVERVIGPDMTITLDFMLARVTSVVSGFKAYPEIMKKNMDMTKGLVYSGALLLALSKNGIAREEAYYMVQDHALATWDSFNEGKGDGASFPERVLADQKIIDIVGKEELESMFSLDRYVEHVDYIFAKVFGG